MRIPPGVGAQDYAAAMNEFLAIVGNDWVFSSDADIALYKDAYSPFWGEPEEKVASAAVAPNSVEQVQQIVRTANKYKVPLYPISTGKNLGYGGSAPVLSGSVVLDLKRMNRILEIDERAATCLVEPGVSYFDLYRHIQEKGYRLWVDTPDPGWGSVIGNAVDRGGGYTMALFRNHFDAHCGMEIVLPNGELMRTGMGAMPGAKTWQQYKSGFGPWIDGMFSQSNFGIVTKMGFWLMREPEAYLNGTVSVPRHADLVPLVDILTRLEDDGIVNGMSHLGSPLLGNNLLPGEFLRSVPVPEVQAVLAQPGGPKPEQLDAYSRKTGVPVWAGLLQFYGPEKIIRAQWEHTKEKFRAIPGVTFTEGDFYKLPLSAAQQEKVHKVSFGIPNLSIFFIGARSGVNTVPGNGHIWFSPIIPRSGEAVFEAQRVFAEAARQLGLPVNPLAMATTYWQRAFIFLFGFPITKDIEVNRKNREAFKALVKIAAEHGWGEYRTAPAYQDAVMDTYSFNNHALLRFHATLKDAIDPNGILSAGRYGIWPRHLREKKS
jgi:4-cresol dehydrogenase (hydroxylating)